jgi:hypothetical protein
MNKIYVVTAVCGEYSDRSEWIVAAYRNKRKAQRHVELATQWQQEFGNNYYTRTIIPDKIRISPFDSMTKDYQSDETTYYLEECDIETKLPDYNKVIEEDY